MADVKTDANNILSLTGLRGQVNDIARPYMFEMIVSAPPSSSAAAAPSGSSEPIRSPLMTATLRTANLPGLSVQEVAVNYFGMTYKVAGTPTYEPLTCTILVDGDYKSRQLWHNYMKATFNYTDKGGPEWFTPKEYMREVYLYGLNPRYGKAVTYRLEMCWISALAALPMSHDNLNAQLTFDATITYSFYTTDKGVTFGSAGNG
jgi:hypothetical protein